MFSEAMLDRQFAICRRLWTAVLTQAVRDVENGTDLEREQALVWIFGRQQVRNGFDAICQWLDLDPDRARVTLMLRRRFRFCFDQVRGKAMPESQGNAFTSTMAGHPTWNLAQSRAKHRRKPGAVSEGAPQNANSDRKAA
ncbi:MAG: hypothetical protein PHU46_06425 [Rhodocyclaceae bacterium]|nr:hypothetical protein [Rhodocyclaceae bacterium]